MRKKYDLIVEQAKDGQYWGRISLGEDLLTGVAPNLEKLITVFIKQLDGFYDLRITKTQFRISYDLQAFFQSHDYLSITGIAKRAKMNRDLLSQYKNGQKHPSAEQVKKIEAAIQEIGKELAGTALVA